MQAGFFDQEDRLAKLEALDDPLPRLYSVVDWQAFHDLLKTVRQKRARAMPGANRTTSR